MRHGAELRAGSGVSPDQLGSPCGGPIDQPHHRLHDVIDIGEIAPHFSVVEQLDRLAGADRGGEDPHRHIRAAPRAVDGEKAQAGRRQIEQVRIGMRHQLVRLLRGAVQAERMIDVVGGAERHPGVGAIDRRRRRIDEMAAAVVAAAFQDVEEADEIGVHIGMRVDQRMPDAGLRGEMDHERKAMLGEQGRGGGAIRQIQPHEFEILGARELLQPRFLQRRIVIRREVIDADHVAAGFAPAGARHEIR